MSLQYYDWYANFRKLASLAVMGINSSCFYDCVTFRYRLQTVRSLAGVSLMLRLLWACLRWDDMAVKPSSAVGTTRKGEKMWCTSSSPVAITHFLWASSLGGFEEAYNMKPLMLMTVKCCHFKYI